MSKTQLNQASLELQEAFDKISSIAQAYPSLLIHKDNFAYSFSKYTESFSRKLDLFRRDLNKFSENIPKSKRGRKGVT